MLSRFFSIIRFAGFCLIFGALPLLLLWPKIDEWAIQAEETEKLDRIKHLENALTKIERWKNPQRFFGQVLTEFRKKSERSHRLTQRFSFLTRSLHKNFPGIFRFTLLDKDGTPIPRFDGLKIPRKIAQTVHLLRKSQSGKGQVSPIQEKFAQKYFGRFNLEELPIGSVFQGPRGEKNDYFFISPEFSGGGRFIAMLQPRVDWEMIGLRNQLAAFNRENKRVFCRLIDLKNRREIEKLPKILLESFSSQAEIILNQKLFQRRLVSPTCLLLASTHCPEAEWIFRRKNGARAAILLIFLAISGAFFLRFVSGVTIFSGIQQGLTFLFLYSALVPLLLFFQAANNFLSEREKFLEKAAFEEIEVALRAFDTQFDSFRQECQKTINDLWNEPISSDKKFFDKLAKMRKAFSLDYCVVGARDGTWQDFSTSVARRTDFGEALATRSFFTSMFDSSDGRSKVADQSFDGDLASALSSANRLFEKMARDVRVLIFISLFGNRQFIQILPIQDARESVKFFLVIGWFQSHFQTMFVQKKRATIRSAYPSLETLIWRPKQVQDKESHPFWKSLSRIRAALEDGVHLTHSTFSDGRQRFFAVGLPGKVLEDFALIGWRSDREESLELLRYKIIYVGICLGIILLTFSLGKVFGSDILDPLGALTYGVNLLKRRDFAGRITAKGNDEFASLAVAFNTMLEGLEDLEVGKIVQEALFPQQQFSQNGWSFFGTCLPAIQVGGDYFDYFSLGENRVLVIVGDVSGHGVGSAMVLGTVKGLLARENEFIELDKLLVSLSSDFLKIFQRKKMMSLIIAVFDFSRNLLTIANAGHNFPYIINEAGAEEIKVSGIPLGTLKKPKFQLRQQNFRDSEKFVFYTDGLVEAISKQDGNQIGYLDFQKILPDCIRSSAQESEKVIRRWHSDQMAPNGQNDDITVLVVQKTVSSQKLGGNRRALEGAKRPTAGDEPREFTSRGEGGRVPPFIEKLQKTEGEFPEKQGEKP